MQLHLHWNPLELPLRATHPTIDHQHPRCVGTGCSFLPCHVRQVPKKPR